MRKVDTALHRWIVAAVFVSIGAAGLSQPLAARADGGAGARAAIKIPNFGQINTNYYRGAQPSSSDYTDLAALGVKTVIDLTRDGLAEEASFVAHAGMKFVRIPLTTSARPSEEAVTQFLSLVNDPANQPVYVHCQGGRHRTGVMTALYRVTHDKWTADQAFAEMRHYEFDKGLGHGALKNFLFDFYARLAAPAVHQ